jgi:hypothetical protein
VLLPSSRLMNLIMTSWTISQTCTWHANIASQDLRHGGWCLHLLEYKK